MSMAIGSADEKVKKSVMKFFNKISFYSLDDVP